MKLQTEVMTPGQFDAMQEQLETFITTAKPIILDDLRPKAKIVSALERRNKSWANNNQIPEWVDINNVGLDQFFTRPDVAKKCWEILYDYMKADGADASHYTFVEPSAGLGAFYAHLPEDRRIGIDVVRFHPDYIQKDFLSWMPSKNGQKYVCVGNPPFGYRAWLALIFLNHAAQFSDYVAFILPMGFQSRGKSNLIDRVKGLHLVHSSRLPADSFIGPDGKSVKVNALWQIWARKPKKRKSLPKACNQYIDLFTVDMRKERLCGQKRLHEADYFLQRTFYSKPPALVKSFSQVKYVCGYGIVIKRNRKEVLRALNNADWERHSNLASHNCRHISMCHIREVVTGAGLIDE